MHKEQFNGIVRHILTGVGGYFVGKGYVDENTAFEIIGILSSVIGLVWSFFTKDKQYGNGYDPKKR